MGFSSPGRRTLHTRTGRSVPTVRTSALVVYEYWTSKGHFIGSRVTPRTKPTPKLVMFDYSLYDTRNPNIRTTTKDREEDFRPKVRESVNCFINV